MSVVLTGTDAQTVRPYNRYSSKLLHVVVLTGTDAIPLDTSVRPYNRYSFLRSPRFYQRHRRIRIRMSVATPTTRSKPPTTQTNIPTILLGRRPVVCRSVIATC